MPNQIKPFVTGCQGASSLSQSRAKSLKDHKQGPGRSVSERQSVSGGNSGGYSVSQTRSNDDLWAKGLVKRRLASRYKIERTW